jgi:hypothetical protein
MNRLRGTHTTVGLLRRGSWKKPRVVGPSYDDREQLVLSLSLAGLGGRDAVDSAAVDGDGAS